LAKFEELVLSVRVDDEGATAKLDQLKRSVADLGSGSQAAGFDGSRPRQDKLPPLAGAARANERYQRRAVA